MLRPRRRQPPQQPPQRRPEGRLACSGVTRDALLAMRGVTRDELVAMSGVRRGAEVAKPQKRSNPAHALITRGPLRRQNSVGLLFSSGSKSSGSLAIFAAIRRAASYRQFFAKSNASWSNVTLDRRRFRILISMRLRGHSAVGVGSLERSSIKAVRRSTLEANSNQVSAHRMYAARELSVVAIRAHSKDSSAHAWYSAAVIMP